MGAARQLDLLEESLDEQFRRFHVANPHVYAELVRLARRAVAVGRRRIGIKMLWEVARWNLLVETHGDPDFKLNNNLHSRYARLIAEREPDLAEAFEFRELRS